MIVGILAQSTVSDLRVAERWYSALIGRAPEHGIRHDGPGPGGGRRILQLADPDGNRVVLMGD